MNILNLIIYILFIVKISKLEKELKQLKQWVFTTEDVDTDFWGEDNETEKI